MSPEEDKLTTAYVETGRAKQPVPEKAAAAPAPETPPIEEESKVAKGGKAVMDKLGGSVGKIPGVNKLPKRLQVVVFFLVIILIVAVVAVAWPSGKDGGSGSSAMDIASLEDFAWDSGPLEGQCGEGTSSPHDLTTLLPENGTIFIEQIDLYLQWQDEEDITRVVRTWENTGDEFEVGVVIGENISEMSPSQTNPDGGGSQGSIQYSFPGTAEINYTYFMVGNASDVELTEDILPVTSINVIVHLIAAGDFYITSGPALTKYNDVGNTYTLTISVSGKILPAE